MATQKIYQKNPVVVVLGHVDHGKTAILDYIRKTNIVEKESGGITQHIGAYEVEFQGRKITFIDTPGHEAFSAMRMRGAKVADIAVLVVDATEGVKNQTKEAIRAVKEAGIPMIVALNKVDKPSSQPEWVMGQLKEVGVIVEKMGGDVPAIKTSAKTGEGINDILETIILIADMEGLKAGLQGISEGVVIESWLDAKTGPLATIIVRNGVIKPGQFIATQSALGKIKRIVNYRGEIMTEVYPGQPCQILGFEKVPKIGEVFKVFSDLESARNYLSEEKLEIFSHDSSGLLLDEEKPVLRVIIKADVLGSLEAISEVLKNLPQEEVVIQVVDGGIGNVNVSDVKKADTTGSVIYGFRVKVEKPAQQIAESKKMTIRTFDVIYELAEDIRTEMQKKLTPQIKRVDIGKIKIIAIFKQKKDSQIVGGRVLDGEILKDTKIEVWRQEEKIGEGELRSIQEEKKNIASAPKGKEIGMLITRAPKIELDDILVVYKEQREKRLIS